jgi:replicative DNA helicase
MATELNDFVPPHNLEAEMNTLGSMILDERAADLVSLILREEDFYRPAHRDVFHAIRQLLEDRRAVDLVTVKNELIERDLLDTVGGVDYLIQIVESVASPSNAEHYARIVLDKATLRRLEAAGRDIVKIVHDTALDTEDKVDEAERRVFEVGQQRLGTDFQPARELAKELFKEIDTFFETGTPVLGVPTEYYDLDALTGGFFSKDFIIVAARPAMGKTSLVLNFALNIAKRRDGAVAVFSLEMGGKQIVQRLLASESRVSMSSMRRTNLAEADYSRLVDACETLYRLPLFIDDASDITALEMRGKCRRLKNEHGLALVVVDYLQLMRGTRRAENRVQEISDIARGLKALAKELDCPVIALSQLNRGVESRENKRPMLSDLRESGSIEAEADLVMFIYRDSYYRRKEAYEDMPIDPRVGEVAEIIIAKHRNGPVGTVLLGFQPMLTNFVNLSDGDKDVYRANLREAHD